MPYLQLDHVSVDLAIYNAKNRALKTALLRRAVGGNVFHSDGTMIVQALEDISLTIQNGERIAFIGKNGAGKTTLLRVFAKIYPPTRGHIEILGHVCSLLDVSMGMDTEATGYQNILMRAILIGLTHKQARALKEDVEEFTELGPYLDLPLRTYSAGMMLRLAFAISTAVQPDIIVLDEVIGAGDQAFAQKARSRINKLIDKASILLLSSHDAGIVQDFCPRTIWMDQGKIKLDGPTREVLAAYQAQ